MKDEAMRTRIIQLNADCRLLIAAFFLASCPALAYDFAGGTGESNDPYQVSTAAQLRSINKNLNLLSKHFVLINDIDLNSRVFSESVIGRSIYHWSFTGSFDGRGHVIRNLAIGTSSYRDNVGFFSAIADTATVKNLGLEDVNVIAKAAYSVGALAGFNSGAVSQCYSTGLVEGGSRVGGLIGSCEEHYGTSRRLWQCFSTVSVTGSGRVGGLVGWSSMDVISCYAAGEVTGAGGTLAGYAKNVSMCYAVGSRPMVRDSGGIILLSYCIGGGALAQYPYDIFLSYYESEDANDRYARTKRQMSDVATYSGWDYGSQWIMDVGQDYPRLIWEDTPGVLITADPNRFGGGKGTFGDPFQIWTTEHMLAVARSPADYDKHFVLMADIDYAPVSEAEIMPIGVKGLEFKGSFDGRQHAIRNFKYHTEQGNAGFFGRVFGSDGDSEAPSGTVRNLHLINVDVRGARGKSCGGLVGNNTGVIESCSVTGCVTGAGWSFFDAVGGLVGFNSGLVSQCAAIITEVRGNLHVGGLIGDNRGDVRQCKAAGAVLGDKAVGGLIGRCDGSTAGGNTVEISSCYAHTSVQGATEVGGLIGSCREMLISTCYSAGGVLAPEDPIEDMVQDANTIGGLIGISVSTSVFLSYWDSEQWGHFGNDTGHPRSTSMLMTGSTFRGWGWDGAWVLEEGHDYPRLVWEYTSGMPIVDDSLRYAGGTGEPNNPYLIETANQLAAIGYHRGDFDKHFLLLNHLDLSVLEEGTMVPIGLLALPFTGTFQGSGYTLVNLQLRCPGQDYVGLFGFISSSETDSQFFRGRVEYLGIEDAEVAGHDNVGVLAGHSSGTIAYCNAFGRLRGHQHVGALAGLNAGTITHGYAQADVYATSYVGGAVGRNNGIITQSVSEASVYAEHYGGALAGYSEVLLNCYASGVVRGIDESTYLGGLVGCNAGIPTANCYATTQVSTGEGAGNIGGLMGMSYSVVTNCFFLHPDDGGGPDNGYGQALHATELGDASHFADWDFLGVPHDGTSEVWTMPEAGGPAVLSMFQGGLPVELPGTGTPDDPYRVASAEDIGAIVYAPCASYRLVRDIDLSGIQWSTAVVPVFGGSLDGNGHCITQLYVKADSYGGLIGLLQKGAIVTDVALAEALITGVNEPSYLGILTGASEGSIFDCQVTGTIMGSWVLGGLAGLNEGGVVSRCCANVSVLGASTLGGVVGENRHGTIVDCYALGDVGGSSYRIGGLVGNDYEGILARCYAANRVTGNGRVGGLVGDRASNHSTIENCYFLQRADGSSPDNGLGTALTDSMMQDPSSFIGWELGSPTVDPNNAVWIIPPEGQCPILGTCEIGAPPTLAGKGTLPDPYLIGSVEQLTAIALNPGANFRLMRDLDLDRKQWPAAPVPVLNGSFDGAGHAIRNLQVKTGTYGGLFGLVREGARITNLRLEDAAVTGLADSQSLGLLAGVNSGTIQNCSTSGFVAHGIEAGGLVGTNRRGVIVQCTSQASINGKRILGGLVGSNQGVIVDCYCTGTVSAQEQWVGGIVGINWGILAYAYSSGRVKGESNLGGSVGHNKGTVTNCHFLSPHDGGGPENGYGTALSRVSMANRQSFVGWDFVEEDGDGLRDIWAMPGGGPPCLAWQTEKSGLIKLPAVYGKSLADAQSEIQAAGWMVGEVTYDHDNEVPVNRVIRLAPSGALDAEHKVDVVVSLGPYDWLTNPGTGRLYDPYVIDHTAQLISLMQHSGLWDKHFVLSGDLDLTDHQFYQALISPDRDQAASEHQGIAFSGTFDGGGHRIIGLSIVSAQDYVGLFGLVDNRAEIRDITLKDTRIIGRVVIQSGGRGRCGTGALAGENWGTITRCGAQGVIIGSVEAGGLVGKNQGNLANCFASGLVTGREKCGGLVGMNAGAITDSYSLARVLANSQTGGLVGSNSASNPVVRDNERDLPIGTILNCYARGSVVISKESESAGGLVGHNYAEDNAIQNCYYLFSEGQHRIDNGSGTALSDAQMRLRDSFAEWDFWGSESDGDRDDWFFVEGAYPILVWQGAIPIVKGLSLAQAQIRMEQAGFKLGHRYYDFDPNIQIDAIITSRPYQVTVPGSTVNLVVSLGPYCWPNNPGDGSLGSPYTIWSPGQLACLGDAPHLRDKHFVLTNDLDMTDRPLEQTLFGLAQSHDSGRLDSPSRGMQLNYTNGDDALSFSGSFDGKGHSISHLDIDVSGYGVWGLFGRIGQEGSVRDVHLEDIRLRVQASSTVGALAGLNFGRVSKCSVTGTISGAAKDIGGVIGNNYGIVEQSFADCHISSDCDSGGAVGGLLGTNYGQAIDCYTWGSLANAHPWQGSMHGLGNLASGSSIKNCYTACEIAGRNGWEKGMLSLSCVGADVASSYFLTDLDIYIQFGSVCGAPLRNAQMKQQTSFVRWDFWGNEEDGKLDHWVMPDNSFPILAWESLRTIPEIQGLPLAQAEKLLRGAGFVLGEIYSDHDEAVPAGRVITTQPQGAGLISNPIGLVISIGPEGQFCDQNE